MKIAKTQADAVVNMFDGMADGDFDKPAPEAMQAYAQNVGAICTMMGGFGSQ